MSAPTPSVPVPVAMPGEEDIARALSVADGNHPDACSNDADSQPLWELYLGQARAVLALIAPILAEKERETDAKYDAAHQAIEAIERADAAEARVLAAEAEIERMKEMRKRLDRRIHCQRKSNRDNWEIVESRRKWLGSQTAQRAWMLQREKRLAAEAALAGERERCALICNPRRWTTEMSHAWHRAIPDVQKAFQDLAEAADSTSPPRS